MLKRRVHAHESMSMSLFGDWLLHLSINSDGIFTVGIHAKGSKPYGSIHSLYLWVGWGNGTGLVACPLRVRMFFFFFLGFFFPQKGLPFCNSFLFVSIQRSGGGVFAVVRFLPSPRPQWTNTSVDR